MQGATKYRQPEWCLFFVSIHAPMQGATSRSGLLKTGCGFQSTPLCKGRRRVAFIYFPAPEFQSTPLCKGRPFPETMRKAEVMFQSTPLCKGRRVRTSASPSYCKFQSTPLCKGRHQDTDRPKSANLFQSTPLCKGRPTSDLLNIWKYVSIHAPMQGATDTVM